MTAVRASNTRLAAWLRFSSGRAAASLLPPVDITTPSACEETCPASAPARLCTRAQYTALPIHDPATAVLIHPSRPTHCQRGYGEQWWFRRFIAVLESYGMSGRLARAVSRIRSCTGLRPTTWSL